MDFKNVLMAIVLSTLVLIGWATFFEAPIVEQQSTENQITKNEDLSSPSVDESDRVIAEGAKIYWRYMDDIIRDIKK